MNYEPTDELVLRVDCYGGPECDAHRPYWEGASPKEGPHPVGMPDGSLRVALDAFPVGTRLVVMEPVCPDCHQERSACELDRKMLGDDCECGFDWQQWEFERWA